jgi:sec-independent protein translocase protein TatA
MFGSTEIIIIALIVLVLFGAKAIPKFAKSIGQAKKEFEKGIKEGESEAEKKDESSESKKEEK